MKAKILLILVFLAMVLACATGCLKKNLPSSPSVTATPTATRTVTATPTVTSTGTQSPSPTPLCTGAIDITSNVDGPDYKGNDFGHGIAPGLNLTHGGTSVGDILAFTLASPMTLSISLCPTEQTGRAMVLYLRSDCLSADGEQYNAGFCSALPQLTGISLAAGTYFIILPENFGSTAPSGGIYTLRIRSGNASSNVCGPSVGVVPEAVPTATFGSCATHYEINGTPPNGTFGDDFSGVRVATGGLNSSLNSDDFISFIPTNSGPVTVSLDCFDNGLNNNDFDIYCGTTCPTDGSSPVLIGSSNSTDPIEEFAFTGTAGATYYLDVQAYLGTGTYRVVIRTP